MRRMSFEHWWEQFKPTGNPVEGSGNGPKMGDAGRMFETYGADLKTVQAEAIKSVDRVWTYVDDGSRYGSITPGLHFVNRLGYFITEMPCADPARDVKV